MFLGFSSAKIVICLDMAKRIAEKIRKIFYLSSRRQKNSFFVGRGTLFFPFRIPHSPGSSPFSLSDSSVRRTGRL